LIKAKSFVATANRIYQDAVPVRYQLLRNLLPYFVLSIVGMKNHHFKETHLEN